MHLPRSRSQQVLATVLWTLAFCFTAVAADTGCQVVFDATTKTDTSPTHVFMTETSELRANKTTTGEAIYAGGAIYTNVKGKWIRSSETMQQMLEQEKKIAKMPPLPATICVMKW